MGIGGQGNNYNVGWTPHAGGQGWYTGSGQTTFTPRDPEAEWLRSKAEGGAAYSPYQLSGNETGQGGMGGAGTGIGQYKTGITAGLDGVYGPQQRSDAMAALGAPGGVGAFSGVPGAAGAELGQQFRDALGAATGEASSDMDRAFSYANSQQQLASQKARSGAGLGLANLLADINAGNVNSRVAQRNAMFQLLSSLME